MTMMVTTTMRTTKQLSDIELTDKTLQMYSLLHSPLIIHQKLQIKTTRFEGVQADPQVLKCQFVTYSSNPKDGNTIYFSNINDYELDNMVSEPRRLQYEIFN